ncbi:hypothetical protein [Mucilaginibacter hurinus]|nr:hypothetical protein [Mucilaginibacter hurinus]
MYETHLLRDPLAATITKVEHHSGGYQYHYKNGWFWAASFMPGEKQLLNVGDSVFKPRYSLMLQTFRRDTSGKYKKLMNFNGDNRVP